MASDLEQLVEAASKGHACCKEEAVAGPKHRVWLYRCPKHGTHPIWTDNPTPMDSCHKGDESPYPPWTPGCRLPCAFVGPGDGRNSKGTTRCDKDCSVCFPAEASAGRRLAALAPTLAREVLDRRSAGRTLAEALLEEHTKRGLPIKNGRCVLSCHYCDALDCWNALGETEEEHHA